MKNVKLVATDMDHTLLTEKNELPPNFDEYVETLYNLGVSFVIASGRPLYTLKSIFPNLCSKITFICDNGGAIYHRGTVIYENLISKVNYASIVDFVENQTDGIVILCGLESAYISIENRKYKEFLSTYYSKIELVEKINTLDCDVDKITCYFPNENSKEIAEKIVMPNLGNDFSVTVSDTIWIDIMNSGVDKGEAMRVLGQHLRINKSEMMAFGDTYNDAEMLKAVKFSYIVENANPDMKQFASYITKSNDEHGVTEVLKQLIKEKCEEMLENE
jgi:Cof subfamily protein (haloacid dehalogenase superfamily)